MQTLCHVARGEVGGCPGEEGQYRGQFPISFTCVKDTVDFSLGL